MTNIYFPEEEITQNDLYFVCYMIERVARRIHQKKKYVVNKIGKAALEHLISLANVLHSKNPVTVEEEWIEEYQLETGNIDVTKVDSELVLEIPSTTQIGKVYQRLIEDTLNPTENYVDAMIRIYNDDICNVIDNYNCSAYYEPSYVVAKAYRNGGF